VVSFSERREGFARGLMGWLVAAELIKTRAWKSTIDSLA